MDFAAGNRWQFRVTTVIVTIVLGVLEAVPTKQSETISKRWKQKT